MIDYSEGEETMEPSNTRPGHIHIGEDDTEGIPRLVEDPQLTELTKGSKKSGSVGRVLQELIKQNFTRNATIVLDSSMGTFSEHVRYIHVRAKMDTGCNENLITMATIEKAGIDGSRLLEIPEDEKIEFHGVESAKCSPLYQIDLIWYQDGDPQMRRDARFYVVKEGPFDILLGSQRFAQDLDSQGNPILVVATREKRKGIRNQI